MSVHHLDKLAVLLSFAVVHPVLAQEAGPVWMVSPSVGVYLPTSDLMSGQSLQLPGSGLQATISFGHKTGLALGLRGSRSLMEKLALEAEFFWANSQIELSGVRSGVGPVMETADARVISVGVNALYEVFRPPFSAFAAHVLGGLGVVNRGGDFFDNGAVLGPIDGGTDISLIIGAGFRYGLAPMVGLRLDVRDYISSYKQSVEGQELDAQLQNDITISAAAEFFIM